MADLTLPTELPRVRGGCSRHEAEQPDLCPDGIHDGWRVVECDFVRDVIECSRCGQQRTVPCNFDEEYR